jgi:ATP-binding cassette subfamily B protein
MAGQSRYLAARLRKLGAHLPYLPRAVALVWEAAGRWTTAWGALLAVQGLLPVATVFVTRTLVNALVPVAQSGASSDTLTPALAWIGVMAGLVLAGEALRAVAGWVRVAQAELVRDHLQDRIQRQSLAVDLAFYDSPEYYDQLHRARAAASDRPLALVESTGALLQNTITLAAMGVVLSQFGLWLPAVLVIGTAPALLVVLRHAARLHQFRQRATPEERRAWYYDWVLTAGETAAELRLFGLGDYFRQAYREVRAGLRREHLALAKSQSRAELGAATLALVTAGGSMAWMVWRTAQGQGTLGDIALFYQALHQGLGLMRSLVGNVGQLYSNILFLGHLFEFLALEPKVVPPARPAPVPELRRELRFERVTFRYPASKRAALEDFSLVVEAGRIAAIVGSNGAGKSTLLKLLCRFYDPDQGRIEIDGVDLRQLPLDELRRRITVLFQQPVHYNATVRENIALGDLGRGQGVEDAAQAAGAAAVVERLPHGYEQLLGRWFADGVELSVGEWQRIALARAFLRQASLLILDEPTSAMDPWAEAEWLSRFRKLATGRTALLITHRFTTAMHADVIHVLDQGRILESGPHQELLARGGRYAVGWRAQMRSAEPQCGPLR